MAALCALLCASRTSATAASRRRISRTRGAMSMHRSSSLRSLLRVIFLESSFPTLLRVISSPVTTSVRCRAHNISVSWTIAPSATARDLRRASRLASCSRRRRSPVVTSSSSARCSAVRESSGTVRADTWKLSSPIRDRSWSSMWRPSATPVRAQSLGEGAADSALLALLPRGTAGLDRRSEPDGSDEGPPLDPGRRLLPLPAGAVLGLLK
mmetsp:Transcript_49085/g.157215  ORF Transcript_49085/g.157215 Transcript_49085/m.157215 type:complete len:211 (-) Transcript_49085:314-946(-)